MRLSLQVSLSLNSLQPILRRLRPQALRRPHKERSRLQLLPRPHRQGRPRRQPTREALLTSLHPDCFRRLPPPPTASPSKARKSPKRIR